MNDIMEKRINEKQQFELTTFQSVRNNADSNTLCKSKLLK